MHGSSCCQRLGTIATIVVHTLAATMLCGNCIRHYMAFQEVQSIVVALHFFFLLSHNSQPVFTAKPYAPNLINHSLRHCSIRNRSQRIRPDAMLQAKLMGLLRWQYQAFSAIRLWWSKVPLSIVFASLSSKLRLLAMLSRPLVRRQRLRTTPAATPVATPAATPVATPCCNSCCHPCCDLCCHPCRHPC